MRNDGQKPQGPAGRANGLIPSSFRAISSYLRIVSSGASTVASTVRSAASSIVDRDEDARYDQVLWAGFDKLECGREVIRRVLLLGYRSGFQVWDVEEAHNVHVLVSRHDGPVSFLQMLPQPLSTLASTDGFSDRRPLLVVCATGHRFQDGSDSASNGGIPKFHGPGNAYYAPSTVQFYSSTSQSYVHILKFRSVVYSVRCSRRVVAVSQAAQVHCFNAATLEMEYTILTNPVVTVGPGSGGIAGGALALGPRWLAYSGSPVQVSNEVHICAQHLAPSGTFPSAASKGTSVAQYGKESSKHLNTGYKKLSRYCSELLPNSNHLEQSRAAGQKANGTTNGVLLEVEGDNVGMVIVKDIVSKALITQFKAHKSPISTLSFDPSGILLATASVHGHNVNVFRIMPERPGGSGASRSYVHLYRLQRGLTDAIIRDITFSDDCCWIMISSSRGTNHLFAISPSGGTANLSESNRLGVMNNPAVQWKSKPADQMLKQNPFASGPPVTLSAVSRIRNGINGWRGAMNGAGVVAIGKNNSMSGAIAAAFHLYKDSDIRINTCSLKSKQHLLVFSPSGCLIQYALRVPVEPDIALAVSPTYESAPGNESKLLVEAIRKWNISQKQRDQDDNFDIYGENRSLDTYRLCQDASRNRYGICPVVQCTTTGSKISTEDRNHFFVSEAELRMHGQVPLWMRSEIYFQLMTGALKLDGGNARGEIEIEKIPTCMIEARTKNLVPVFDYLVNPKSQPSSVAASDGENGQGLPQGSGVFPD